MTKKEYIQVEHVYSYAATINGSKVTVWEVVIVGNGETRYVFAHNVHHFNTERLQGYFVEPKFLYKNKR